MPRSAEPADAGERFEMRTNFDGLVRVLAKNLYPEPDVFVRELVQNAHDGIRRRQFTEPEVVGRIDITIDAGARTLTFEDNGIGLDRDDILEFLSVVGATGTGQARSLLEPAGGSADVLIGQFGIGTLAALVVADRVTVHTRKAGSDSGWLWENGGSAECTLRALHRTRCGTCVTVYLSRDHSWMMGSEWLRRAIVRYCDFIPYPIYIGGAGPVNVQQAPWHVEDASTQQDGFAAFLSRRVQGGPDAIIPVSIDAPVRARGVLYICGYSIPDVTTAGLVDIYVRRMFVRGREPDLLPSWATFLRGMIDSPDLTPTAARDNVRRDDAFRALTGALGQLIVNALVQMATGEPEKFRLICTRHHHHVNAIAASHAAFFDAVADVLLFRTSRGLQPLPACIGDDAVTAGARALHYFPSELDARQYHALADARGVTAVHAASEQEEDLLVRYVQSRGEGLRLVRLDVSRETILFRSASSQTPERLRRVEREAESALRGAGLTGIAVAIRSFDPASLPAIVLVSAETATDLQLVRLAEQTWLAESLQDLAREMLENDGRRATTGLRLLLNEAHPLIHELVASPRAPAARDAFCGLLLLACMRSPDLLAREVAGALNASLLRLIESAARSGTSASIIDLSQGVHRAAHS